MEIAVLINQENVAVAAQVVEVLRALPDDITDTGIAEIIAVNGKDGVAALGHNRALDRAGGVKAAGGHGAQLGSIRYLDMRNPIVALRLALLRHLHADGGILIAPSAVTEGKAVRISGHTGREIDGQGNHRFRRRRGFRRFFRVFRQRYTTHQHDGTQQRQQSFLHQGSLLFMLDFATAKRPFPVFHYTGMGKGCQFWGTASGRIFFSVSRR